MRGIIRRILNTLAYAAAGVVILLAILVGLFRLFLPRLPEYQEDIKGWAAAAIGMQVEFTDMNARWRLTGPELNFYDARLVLPEDNQNLIEASEVTVGVGLLRLLFDRTLVVDRILVRDCEISLQRTADNRLMIQGLDPEELSDLLPDTGSSGDVVFVGQDLGVRYREPDSEEVLAFEVALVEATRLDELLSLDASIDLDEGFGSRLDISVDQRRLPADATIAWDVFVEGRSLGLSRWAYLLPDGVAPITSGTGDVSLWLQWSEGRVVESTANLLIEDFSLDDAERRAPLEVEGRLEFSRVANRFLVNANELRLRTVDGDWPRSNVQLQIGLNADEVLDSFNLQSSYLRVTDASYFSSWLPEQAYAALVKYRPTGELRDVNLQLNDLQSDSVRFDVSATLSDAGIAANDGMPGIRNFSGSVRADTSGGRVESTSSNLRLQLPDYVAETIAFDDAIGTLIWRRSGENLTVLSDRLRLRNADFDSQSSLQVTVAGNGEAPVVDFESTWSINDVASAKRFLPQPIIHPALYRWLNEALVAGRMSNGRARLQGPLDKFPFDGGEGEFRIDATLQTAVMRYANNWPEARIRTMDVVLDGMRLYTERNSAVSAGNATTDARVEIADLRKPVLTIDAFSTGSLESIRQFTLRSPISRVFGNQLDRVSVAGDASFNLLLTYPITDRQNYDFSTRIQVSDGTIQLEAFPPAVSELYGIVNISRADLSSESLFGKFLGEPVSLALSRVPADDGGYNVIVDAEGRVTANGLIAELNAPLGEIVTGAGDYTSRVRFPKVGEGDGGPLSIAVATDLVGFDVSLPAPLRKASDTSSTLDLRIEIPEAGHIASSATLGESIRWIGDFRKRDDVWDFDRGALSFGGSYPDEPASRGLHVSGEVEELRVDEWLAVAQGGAGTVRVGDRIRAIDLSIDNLFAFGQLYTNHRIAVDRGGNRWFVNAEGDALRGDITVPYDLGGEQPITLDMELLTLPGLPDEGLEASTEGGISDVDPRTLPPVTIDAQEFAIGDRYLGALSAQFEKAPDGLRAAEATATDASFGITGTAGWVVEPTHPGAEARSYINAALVSRNVEQTMRRLNYGAGIDSSEMQLDVDVSWPGGPDKDFLEQLDGSVSVRFGSGQLNEIDPGAGRVFGLMSVVALPRRLSLDFRDVFDKGFGFDEIRGTFNIDRGEAYTCDLSLRGPAAEIVIIGSVDLADSMYNQTALVSANVGNTLPLVGTVVAGPQVGAALLIFSQIFKKPLQEVGRVYYGIDGPFDEPQVDVADGQRFEESSEFAGCLAESS